jgi:hypothetical protein
VRAEILTICILSVFGDFRCESARIRIGFKSRMRYQPSAKLLSHKASRERHFCRDPIRARFGRELGTFTGTFSGARLLRRHERREQVRCRSSRLTGARTTRIFVVALRTGLRAVTCSAWGVVGGGSGGRAHPADGGEKLRIRSSCRCRRRPSPDWRSAVTGPSPRRGAVRFQKRV